MLSVEVCFEVLDGWSVMVITDSAVTLISLDVGTTAIEVTGLHNN